MDKPNINKLSLSTIEEGKEGTGAEEDKNQIAVQDMGRPSELPPTPPRERGGIPCSLPRGWRSVNCAAPH